MSLVSETIWTTADLRGLSYADLFARSHTALGAPFYYSKPQVIMGQVCIPDATLLEGARKPTNCSMELRGVDRDFNSGLAMSELRNEQRLAAYRR